MKLMENKIRIKSNKDLKSISHSKTKPQIVKSKSKGPATKRFRKGNKICWNYIGNKDNIKKYMKKKRKKMAKEELKEKLFDFKKQTKI